MSTNPHHMAAPPGLPLWQEAEKKRGALKMGKRAWAERIGIGSVTYDRLKTQANPPHGRTVNLVANAIGISYDQAAQMAGLLEPEQPDWAKALNAATAEFSKSVGQMGRILTVQGAMTCAYRGDIDGAREVLANMEPEQLYEVSAAASILASLADEALKGRGRGDGYV